MAVSRAATITALLATLLVAGCGGGPTRSARTAAADTTGPAATSSTVPLSARLEVTSFEYSFQAG